MGGNPQRGHEKPAGGGFPGRTMRRSVMRRFDLLHRGRIDRRQRPFARHASRTREARRGFQRRTCRRPCSPRRDQPAPARCPGSPKRRGCRLGGAGAGAGAATASTGAASTWAGSAATGAASVVTAGAACSTGRAEAPDGDRRCRHFERVGRRNRDRAGPASVSTAGATGAGSAAATTAAFDRCCLDVYRCRLRLDSGRCCRFGMVLDHGFGDDGAPRRLPRRRRCGRVGRFGSSRCFRRHGLHRHFAFCALLGVVDACAVSSRSRRPPRRPRRRRRRSRHHARRLSASAASSAPGRASATAFVGFRVRMGFAAGDGFQRGRMLGRLAALAALATFLARHDRLRQRLPAARHARAVHAVRGSHAVRAAHGFHAARGLRAGYGPRDLRGSRDLHAVHDPRAVRGLHAAHEPHAVRALPCLRARCCWPRPAGPPPGACWGRARCGCDRHRVRRVARTRRVRREPDGLPAPSPGPEQPVGAGAGDTPNRPFSQPMKLPVAGATGARCNGFDRAPVPGPGAGRSGVMPLTAASCFTSAARCFRRLEFAGGFLGHLPGRARVVETGVVMARSSL